MLTDCFACQEQREARSIAAGSLTYGPADGRQTWEYTVLECTDCGAGRVTPLPPAGALREMYATDYCTYQPKGGGAAQWLGRSLRLRVARLAAYRDQGSGLARSSAGALVGLAERLGARTVPWTASFPLTLPKTAAILDYGCGSGWWLKGMHGLGYARLWAYDVAQPRLEALRQLGITVCVDPQPLPGGTFDCVRLEHVLEHLPDPGGALARIRASLRPGGSVVLVVPDHATWSRSGVRPEDANLSLPHHLTQFTEVALRRLAASAGLSVVGVQHLPIWEVAQTAFRSATGFPATEAPRGLGRGWRRQYYAWSRARGRGEYLGARLVPS